MRGISPGDPRSRFLVSDIRATTCSAVTSWGSEAEGRRAIFGRDGAALALGQGAGRLRQGAFQVFAPKSFLLVYQALATLATNYRRVTGSTLPQNSDGLGAPPHTHATTADAARAGV